MIISASRRTDIPAYYSDWFFERIRAGYVLVRNPMNTHQVSRIILSPDVCDGIVFWTKNPLPMLGRLSELSDYPYYFQFTLNAYGRDVEPNIPQKDSVLIPGFIKLSRLTGRERVVWRYDPILLNEKYTLGYHLKYFEKLAQRLHPYTEKCIVSIVDNYRSICRGMKALHAEEISEEAKLELLGKMADISRKYGLCIESCAEAGKLEGIGIGRARCIDAERLGRIGKMTLKAEKDKNQRKECGCAQSIDIGVYDTCQGGCLYCYANHSAGAVCKSFRAYNPLSPMLCSDIGEKDIITERTVKSLREEQTSLFGN